MNEYAVTIRIFISYSKLHLIRYLNYSLLYINLLNIEYEQMTLLEQVKVM
jgi:hypothetical protein